MKDTSPSQTKSIKNRKFVNEMRAKKGLAPLPETEDAGEVDELPQHLFWIWEAFTILSRTRLVNQAGPQPIQINEVLAYCRLESLNDEFSRHDLLHFITALDIVWLKITYETLEKNREEERKKAERDAKRKGRR